LDSPGAPSPRPSGRSPPESRKYCQSIRTTSFPWCGYLSRTGGALTVEELVSWSGARRARYRRWHDDPARGDRPSREPLIGAGWTARQRHRFANRGGVRRRRLSRVERGAGAPDRQATRAAGDRGRPGCSLAGAQSRAGAGATPQKARERVASSEAKARHQAGQAGAGGAAARQAQAIRAEAASRAPRFRLGAGLQLIARRAAQGHW
jgi:hypothetical protein